MKVSWHEVSKYITAKHSEFSVKKRIFHLHLQYFLETVFYGWNTLLPMRVRKYVFLISSPQISASDFIWPGGTWRRNSLSSRAAVLPVAVWIIFYNAGCCARSLDKYSVPRVKPLFMLCWVTLDWYICYKHMQTSLHIHRNVYTPTNT